MSSASATVPTSLTAISYFGNWASTQYPAHFSKGEANAVVDRTNDTATFTMRYTGSYNTDLVRHLTATISRPEGSYFSAATASGCILNATDVLNQQITFVATTFTDQEISGTYTTTNPDDNGTFVMRAAMTATVKNNDQSGSRCTIM